MWIWLFKGNEGFCVGLNKLTMVHLNMWVICWAVQQNDAVNGY